MARLTFLVATYNEQEEIMDLLSSVKPWVDELIVSDDGSTDHTITLAETFAPTIVHNEHVGLPETIKDRGLQKVLDGSWVLMLDADERVGSDVLFEIREFIDSEESEEFDYVYFNQFEIIDGRHVRTFQKCKLFKKEVVHFPSGIHEDDRFDGHGTFREGWVVYHRKTSEKQITRETEYLATYARLLAEGKIDEGRYTWLVNLHHFVKPHG